MNHYSPSTDAGIANIQLQQTTQIYVVSTFGP